MNQFQAFIIKSLLQLLFDNEKVTNIFSFKIKQTVKNYHWFFKQLSIYKDEIQ